MIVFDELYQQIKFPSEQVVDLRDALTDQSSGFTAVDNRISGRTKRYLHLVDPLHQVIDLCLRNAEVGNQGGGILYSSVFDSIQALNRGGTRPIIQIRLAKMQVGKQGLIRCFFGQHTERTGYFVC